MISSSEALSFVSFTTEEKKLILKFEAFIDSALSHKFEGAPVKIDCDHTATDMKLAYAVARLYESRGGWRVNITTWFKEGDEKTPRLSFVFVPFIMPTLPQSPQVQQPPKQGDIKTLPPIVSIAPSTEKATKRLLVRMPTRARPEQALSVLAKYRAMAGVPITLEVVIDEDDVAMLAAPVLQRLNALGCMITVGPHKSKIEACNGGRWSEWDILLLASDDMVPVKDGYAKRIIEEMERHWPHLDGAVYFNDGYQGPKCCTLPIFGRRLYEQYGCVYDPEYKSLWCDKEQTEVLQARGRLVYVPGEPIIEHRHHASGKAERDALYMRNDVLWKEDEATYLRRKAERAPQSQFEFGEPPLRLSICIASMPSRATQLELLLDELWWQIQMLWWQDLCCTRALDERRLVEILVDSGDGTIGEKRQRLLERAKGHFVCFIDDDDWIHHKYVDRILKAIVEKPDADCVYLKGIMTTSGEVPEVFECSIKYNEWTNRDGMYQRTPLHLSPIRRELALKAGGYPPIRHGEDHKFSMALRPLLKTEAPTGDEPLYLYLFQPRK